MMDLEHRALLIPFWINDFAWTNSPRSWLCGLNLLFTDFLAKPLFFEDNFNNQLLAEFRLLFGAPSPWILRLTYAVSTLIRNRHIFIRNPTTVSSTLDSQYP
ncbi:unnamed protein product [Calicophoron daubneyi]|uniref:Uncharacterized protein n=1 Tax=Calicophoron daubneyi TaxID=300641 RepID=A0AAV2TA53_CALDB